MHGYVWYAPGHGFEYTTLITCKRPIKTQIYIFQIQDYRTDRVISPGGNSPNDHLPNTKATTTPHNIIPKRSKTIPSRSCPVSVRQPAIIPIRLYRNATGFEFHKYSDDIPVYFREIFQKSFHIPATTKSIYNK